MKNYIFDNKNTSSCVWNKGRGTHNSIHISTMTGVKNIIRSSAEIQSSEEKIDGLILQHLPIKAYTYIIGFIIGLFLLTGGNALASTVDNLRKDLSKPPFDLHTIIEKAEHIPSLNHGKYIVKDSTYEVMFDSSGITYIPLISGKTSSDKFSFHVSSIGTSSGELLWKNNKVTKPFQKENSIVYQRSADIQEVYENLNKGVEQSWIFKKNPGVTDSKDLRITIDVETSLQGRQGKDNGLEFIDKNNISRMKYTKVVLIDAVGKVLEAAPTWQENKSRIILNIPGNWFSSAAFPVIVDPVLGTTDVNVDAQATLNEAYPAVAFGGNKYLVVYQIGTPALAGNGTTDIKGAFVDPATGTVTALASAIAVTASDEEHPSVAFDQLNSKFLVVWEQWGSQTGSGIMLRTVTTAGTLGTTLTIAAVGTRIQAYPTIACCDGTTAATTRARVSYARSAAGVNRLTTLRGAAISSINTEPPVTAGSNPTGTLTNTAGPTSDPTLSPSVSPKIIYAGAANKYILVWEDFSDAPGNINAQMFDVAGAVWQTQWTMAATAGLAERYPVPAYDGTNFLAAYQRGAAGAADIYGQFALTTGTGANLNAAFSLVTPQTGIDETNPGIAWIAGTCSPRYLVTWAQGTTIKGRPVTASPGTLESIIDIAVNTTSNKFTPAVTANEGACGYFVAWGDNPVSTTVSKDVYAQRIGYPNISGLSPTSGVVGASISINGLNFGADPGAGNRSTASNNIKINGVQVPDANVSFWSDATVTFTIPTGTAAGTYPVTITAGSWTSNSNNLTVSAFGPAAKVAFTTQPVGGSGGTVWAAQPVATIQDALGNTVTTAIDNVTLSISSNPSAGILTCTNTTVAAVNGVATFAGCKIDKAGSPYTLQAAATGLTSAISNTFNITVGTPSQLIFSTQPVYGITGTAWTTQPVVTIQDAGGNTVTTAANSITLAIGTNPGGGVLACTTNPLSAVSGLASFAGCQINMAGNGYTLTASATGLTGAASVSFNIIQALQISTVSLPNGYEWLNYSTTVTATGGVTPYTWSISAGSLPLGLTINSSSGLITGTPNAFGTYNFTVQVTDMTNPTQQIATKAFTVIIYQLTTITVTPANPVLTPGQTVQFTATGTYSDNNTSDISAMVTWGSTNPSVATVNSTGLASGVALGNVTITATK